MSFLDFLLHPFRKPKRVRTAFSPSQLLKLEHAFESNQYVVGAERKALAQALNLSETQVCDIFLLLLFYGVSLMVETFLGRTFIEIRLICFFTNETTTNGELQ